MNCLTTFLLGILISLIIFLLFTQIKEYYDQIDPVIIELREKILPLADYPEYKDVIENIKIYKGNKSYTINKEKTYLCLYDENGEIYDKNFLMYVLLHELSHSINKKDIGHTEEFHKVFEEVLKRATFKGIYDPNKPLIQNYCLNGSGK